MQGLVYVQRMLALGLLDLVLMLGDRERMVPRGFLAVMEMFGDGEAMGGVGLCLFVALLLSGEALLLLDLLLVRAVDDHLAGQIHGRDVALGLQLCRFDLCLALRVGE